MRIKELPATPIDPEHIATADRGFRCLYTGVDLSGWVTAEENRGHWKPSDWVLSYDGKSPAADPSIATEQAFGDFGFIFDVRRPDKATTARILLRGSDKAAVVIDPGDPVMADHLGKGRGWSRFEGTLRADRLTLSLNGREVFKSRPVPGVPDRGPIRIIPSGRVDLANVYVRELKDAERAP
jgi:hypothetical protein